MFDWWWAYLALGAFVGFFSGLLGIGGGAAMVPMLAFIYAAKGFPPASVVHLALGTGMATMVFTAASSAVSHHRHGAVNWAIMRTMAPGIIAGTFGGAFLAGFLDLRVLSVIFTALIYYLATQMLLDRKPRATRPMPGVAGALFAAGAIGVISSLTATGGAALVVAYLVRREVSVHEAIGTAAAIGWPLAVFGATGYVVSGLRVGELPPYSLGYAYLPAVAAIATASMLMAPAGARLAHRTPGKRLKKIFAVVLFALATSMLLRFV
jgi:uncharacterized membrane protein YfcA